MALMGPRTADAIDVLERVARDDSGKRFWHQTVDRATSMPTMAKAVIYKKC